MGRSDYDSCASHYKAAIGGRYSSRRIEPWGADHENDDEGTAFCCAGIGASGQGAVRSGMEAECSTDTATEIAQQVRTA